MRSENPGVVVTGALPRLEPLRYVRTDALEVAYFEAGPSDSVPDTFGKPPRLAPTRAHPPPTPPRATTCHTAPCPTLSPTAPSPGGGALTPHGVARGGGAGWRGPCGCQVRRPKKLSGREGPSDGEVALLLHGFPYDIHSYVDVIPRLVEAGHRVIAPYLRGHGPTRFLDRAAPRSGQQAAIGSDVIALLDALDIPRAIFAGYDWGGRAACVAAALWPERCAGIVSVNSYLIQDISSAMTPIRPDLEAGFWYFYYFLTERGRAGLTAYRREIAKVIWTRNSPNWHFDDATLERAAVAFDNPDYVDVVLHSYRHRLGYAPSYPPYDQIEKKLTAQPAIMVPAVTLDG